MNIIKKILITFVTLEILHYGYFLFKLNYSREKIRLSLTEDKSIIDDEKVSNYLKIDKSGGDNLNDITDVYYHVKNKYDLSKIYNFKIITPYPFLFRLLSTCYFFYYLYILKNIGFNVIITEESIIIEKITTNKNLYLFHTGVMGNIHHMIDFIKQIDQNKYSVMIIIFRSNVTTMFWNNSSLLEHVKFLKNKIIHFENINILAHSFGAFILETVYNYEPLIEKKILSEILIQPGNILSMGLIFISSSFFNFTNYYKFISRYSKLSKHNYIFTYMVKSLAGTSTILAVNDLNGIRFMPRKNLSGYLIISNDDPLINTNNYHPFCDEINYIFPNHKVISIPGYHGITSKEYNIIIKCIKDTVNCQKI